MNRKLGALLLCLFAALAVACSKDEPATQLTSTPSSIPGLPTGTGLTHVDVTKVETPSSIDPKLLPENARRASAMTGLTPEQKICIDDTIYQTIQADGSIASDNAKVASVMGSAMTLCGGDTFAKSLVQAMASTFGLTPDQAACVQQKMAADPDASARLLGAASTADPMQVVDAFGAFEEACGFTMPGE